MSRITCPRRRAHRVIRAAIEAMERRVLLSTVTVNTTADRIDPPGSATVSLRDAIRNADASHAATTIAFDPNVFATAQRIVLKNGGLALSHNTFAPIILTGPQAGLVVAGDLSDAVFAIAKGVRFHLLGISIINGGSSGIANAGEINISHCTIARNSGQYAGGIENSGTMTIAASTISNNLDAQFESHGGGGVENSGTLTISSTLITANHDQSSDGGGGINNLGKLTIVASTISGNKTADINRAPGASYGYLFGTGSGGINNSGKAAISNCTISENTAGFAEGDTIDQYGFFGAAINNVGVMTIAGTTVANNSVTYYQSDYQAGCGVNNQGTLTITSSTFKGDNSASLHNIGKLVLSDSTITGNTNNRTPALSLDGGVQINRTYHGSALVNNCTISGNAGIGVLSNQSRATLSSCTITNCNNGITAIEAVLVLNNCTISGNSGPGIFARSGSYVQVNDCTITANHAQSGGGIYSYRTDPATVTLSNSIVADNADNIDGSGPDVFGVVWSLSHNLIGQTDGSSGWSRSDFTGTSAHPLDPRLSPLGNFGGLTQTQVPMAGSPALGAGSMALVRGMTKDQRGLPRISGGVLDIGAVQVQRPAKIAIAGPGNYTTLGQKPVAVALGSFSDPGAKGPFIVDINWGDGSLKTVFSRSSAGSLGMQTHVFQKAGITHASISVTDSSGALSNLARFDVTVAAAPPISIVVNTYKDQTDPAGSAVVSLRDAIIAADHANGPVMISFDQRAFAKPRTITLDGKPLDLSNDLYGAITITGPTAALTISGNNKSNLFLIDRRVSSSMSDLTLSGGDAYGLYQTYGGAIQNLGTLTVTNCLIDHNHATSGGGIENRGDLVIRDSTISDNNAAYGGGIVNRGQLALTITSVTGNTTTYGGGGGLYNRGDVTIQACTLANNQARVGDSGYGDPYGGGIDNLGTLSISNTTIAGNHCDFDGGGIDNFATATLTNCTISGNTGDLNGGIVNDDKATLKLANSIVSGNLTTTSPAKYPNASFAPDVGGSIASLGHNLIGKTDGSSGWLKTDLTGTMAHPLSAHLSPLDFYGGPTETQVPLARSPAIGAGDLALLTAGLSTDQRGFARITDGLLDLGAVELQRAGAISVRPPSKQNVIAGDSSILQLGSFTALGASGPFQVIVNWGDGSSNDHFTIAAAGSLGTLNHLFINTGALTGAIDIVDARGDISQPAHFSIAATTHPLITIVVNTAKDRTDAAGTSLSSLRDAINMADHSFGAVAISFDSTAFASNQTISLASPLTISHNIFGPITISGPAAGVVVRGGFNLDAGTASVTGVHFMYGGITNHGHLTLTNCTISRSSAGSGGAIVNSGTMNVIDCTIRNNNAVGYEDKGYSPGDGGAIFNDIGASLTITGSVLSANNAGGGEGGAIANFGHLSLSQSTISGNIAANHGAIDNFTPLGKLTIDHCTFTGNISGGATYDGYPMHA
jgi:hypothetical protein